MARSIILKIIAKLKKLCDFKNKNSQTVFIQSG